MSSEHDDDNTLKGEDDVRQELRRQGIRLWNPPYFGTRTAAARVAALATRTGFDTIPRALTHLRALRQHALRKLANTHRLWESLDIRVLGTDSASFEDPSSLPETWAESTEIKRGDAAVTIHLHHPNPNLTVAQLARGLQRQLPPRSGIRLISKGKALATSIPQSQEEEGGGAVEKKEEPLKCLLLDGTTTGKTSLLCLVQSTAGTATTSQPERQPSSSSSSSRPDDDARLVASIRQAASRLQGDAGLDVTDAAGDVVSMTRSDRVAFLTALGLHALGRERLLRRDDDDSAAALAFYLEADAAWERLDETWRTRVDNYGMLQLDIAWVYLRLRSLEQLQNVVQRLERAERTLRAQVNPNFITLALVQADMEKPVPALAAIFVRLFLLQGVAWHYARQQLQQQQQQQSHNDDTAATMAKKSKERLDWAWGLAKSLRAVSPPEAVAALVEAVDATPALAISALRRTNGNVDRAATMIQEEGTAAERATEERYRQRNLGLCRNGTDYVDLQMLEQLKPLLGLDPSNDEVVGSALLRLNDNNLDQALNHYQNSRGDGSLILEQVAELDASQGVPRKRSRIAVDEIALASLESMGVDDATARRALEMNGNNVERAVLWITNRNDTVATADSSASSTASTPYQGTEENNEPKEKDKGVQDNADDTVADPADGNAPGDRHDAALVGPSPIPVAPAFDAERARMQAEREAVSFLRRVLGQVLEQQQHQGEDGFLGNSLEDEWGYLQQFRQ